MSRITLFDKPPDFSIQRAGRIPTLRVRGDHHTGKGGTCEFKKHPPRGVRTSELSASPKSERTVEKCPGHPSTKQPKAASSLFWAESGGE
jgi:hypothetical protein